jgi:chromosomal replication initiation ATPase DnaA
LYRKSRGTLVSKDDPEIPAVQKQPGQPTLEAVLGRVAQVYGQRIEDVLKPTRRPSEARQVGIYAARRVAGAELKTVALHFGLGYTAVSRRVGTVAHRLRNDPRLRSRVEKLYKDKVKT